MQKYVSLGKHKLKSLGRCNCSVNNMLWTWNIKLCISKLGLESLIKLDWSCSLWIDGTINTKTTLVLLNAMQKYCDGERKGGRDYTVVKMINGKRTHNHRKKFNGCISVWPTLIPIVFTSKPLELQLCIHFAWNSVCFLTRCVQLNSLTHRPLVSPYGTGSTHVDLP